jgi:uncharacterized protein YjdB
MSRRALLTALAAVSIACSSGPGSTDVARVVIEGESAFTLIVDDTRQLVARAEDGTGTAVVGAQLVWSTTAAGIATVSTGGLLTAISPGAATIVARSGDRADTVQVTVASSSVANVVVTIPKTLLKVSDTVTAVATAVNAVGDPVTGRPVTWTSSHPDAGVVTPFGLVLGVAPGNPVTITATIDGKSGSTTIAIIPAVIAEVIVSPDTAILAPGGTVQMQVSVIDEFGFEAIDRTITWSSFQPNIATIDQAGMVTATALGESTVRATVDGAVGDALIRVLAVETDKYRIEVTNYLVYPIEVLENGVSVGSIGPQSTGVIARPLRASFRFGWALSGPNGRGESLFEEQPAIADPTGTIHFDVDNVLDDGRVFYTPFIRNIMLAKAFADPLPKVEAQTCFCSVSSEVSEVRDLGYWLLNPTSVMRFFAATDPNLTDPRLIVPVASVDMRSGIWRYTLSALP